MSSTASIRLFVIIMIISNCSQSSLSTYGYPYPPPIVDNDDHSPHALHPPTFIDPSDPPRLSFDPVHNWIRLTQRNEAKLAVLIDNCLKTICKDYMHECHWYCDPMKGIAERRWLCDECLGPFIRLCGKCFEA